jgi:hypothetical protein
MTQEEFQTYRTLSEKFSEYCNDIFSYIKKNYASVLCFGEYSEFSNAKYYLNDVTFEYYDSHDFESSLIEIPINDFLTDPYKWADEWAKAIIAAKERTRQRLNEIALQKERDEYERLKKKFEK